jgi:hypothetical protein
MADDVYIDRLVVELTADITEFRKALLEAIGLTETLGTRLNDAMARHVGAGDIINAGITAALAGAAIQASRTQIAVAGALQAIGRSAREAHEQIAAAQRAQAALAWGGPTPPRPPAGGGALPPGGGGGGSSGGGGAIIVPTPGGLPATYGGPAQAPPRGQAGAPPPAPTGPVTDMYHLGGVYQPGNRIWRIRQADLRRRAEGTPAGSPEWQEYEEARRAAGLGADPNIPTPRGPVVGPLPGTPGYRAAEGALQGPPRPSGEPPRPAGVPQGAWWHATRQHWIDPASGQVIAPPPPGPPTVGLGRPAQPPPGVPTLAYPHQDIGGAARGMTAGQAAMVARGVASGRVSHPDPRVRADGDLPREMSDSYSARIAHDLETAAGMTGPPPGPAPPGREWDPRTRSWVYADTRQAAQERDLRGRARSTVQRAAMTRSLGEAGDAAEDVIDEAMDLGARMERGNKAAKEATSVFSLLRGTVGGLGRALGVMASETLRFGLSILGMGALFEPIMAGVAGLGAAFTASAGAALAAAGPFLLIGGAIAAFVALFAAANWDRVRALMDWLKGRVEEVLGDRWNRIVAAAHRVLAEFGGAAGSLWEKIAAPLHALGAVVFPLLQGLAELVIRALDAIGAAVEGLLNILADFIGLIGALIEGDWAGVWEHARGIVASFVDAIWEIFGAFFPELMDGMNDWWDGVVGVIRGKGEEIRAGFERTTAQVTGLFAAMPAAIEGFARGIYEGFQKWMGERFGELVDWVGGKVGEVVGFFRDAWDAVVGHSYVPDMVDGISEHFGRLQGEMVDPAKAACDQVVDAFAETQTEVDAAITDTMDAVKDGLKGGLRDALKGEFSFGDFISDIVMRAGDKAIDKAVDLLMEQMDGMLDALQTALGDIFNGMFNGGAANGNGIFSAIGNFFGGLFGGGRAGGMGAGPVFPGRIYDVGEFGREKFVPASAGYILNDNDMRAMGGRGGVVNHFHFPAGTDARSFQASRGQIEAMMLRTAGRGRRNS